MKFSDLQKFMQAVPEHQLCTDDYQVYSNRCQINIKRAGNNLANIVIYRDEVNVYRCPRNGYCNYSNPAHYNLDDEIPAWAWNSNIEL